MLAMMQAPELSYGEQRSADCLIRLADGKRYVGYYSDTGEWFIYSERGVCRLDVKVFLWEYLNAYEPPAKPPMVTCGVCGEAFTEGKAKYHAETKHPEWFQVIDNRGVYITIEGGLLRDVRLGKLLSCSTRVYLQDLDAVANGDDDDPTMYGYKEYPR